MRTCAHNLLKDRGLWAGVGGAGRRSLPSYCVSSPGMVANGGCHHLKSCFQKYYVWHRSHFLPSFWVSLSTSPLLPATQGRIPWATGPFCPPRAVKGWALALLQLLGAQRGENQRQAMWALLSSPSFKEVQTNPVPMPGLQQLAAYSSSLSFPILSSFPERRQGLNSASWTPRGPRTPGRASNTRRGPQCWAGASMLGRGHSETGLGCWWWGKATETFPLTLSHCGSSWDLGLTHSE